MERHRRCAKPEARCRMQIVSRTVVTNHLGFPTFPQIMEVLPLALGTSLLTDSLTNHASRPSHAAHVYARDVFADDAQGKQLRSGKQRDDGCQEGKAGSRAAVQPIGEQDVAEQSESEKREEEADDTCDLQRQDAEAGDHVEGMQDQPAERVIGNADPAQVVFDDY